MLSAKLRTTAALLAVAAGLTFAANANATRVSSNPTGNGNLDSYCAAAADLINQAFAEADHADNLGYYDEGQEYWDTAIAMLTQAKANGCSFSQALVAASGDVIVVSARPTGSIRLDAFCRQSATQINQAYRDGNASWAGSIRRGAEQKGCRFITVHRVATAAQTGAMATAIG